MDKNLDSKIENKIYELPSIEVVEIVCQNTPDFTHGTNAVDF